VVQPLLTHESRCLIIAAGMVLERNIERRARAIAASRAAQEISPDDIEQAASEFFRAGLADLPGEVQRAILGYRQESIEAA